MTSLKALIIDDELDICILLSGILKVIGIKANFAVTLTEGRKNLSENDFQILFLDINLPDGSGLDELSNFKQRYPELGIIMISAYDGEKEREFARKQGAMAFIGKPLSGGTIRKTLKEHFKTLNM